MSEYTYPPEGTQAGTVIGPGSSTDNAVARFNGTTGESVQNSGVIIDDSNNVTGVVGLAASGAVTASTVTTTGEVTALDGTTGEIPLGVSAGRATTTGLLTGGVLSVDADPAKFDITSGTGIIVDKWTNPLSPTYTYVSWNAFDAQTITNLATTNITGVAINSSGAVVQFDVADFSTATRDYIMLGFLIHPNHTSISGVNNGGTNAAYDIGETVLDLALAVGTVNLSGNVYSANGANLNINKSAGTAFSVGVNIKTSKKFPNTVTSPSQTAPTFFFSYRDGSGGYTAGTTTTINPNQYDDGSGTLATVSNNKWTIQRFFAAETFTVVEYGQNQYDTEAEALSAIQTEAHTSNPDLATLLLRSYLVVKKGATALNNSAVATFVEASRFGGGTSNSATSSTTNLQQSYNNSSDPEILTDSTRGALTIRRGSAADTDAVLETQNNAGTVKFSVTGAGNVAIAGTTTFTGTVTTPLTASRAVVTGASSELAISATTATELGYVSGVTSAIQTQLNAKAPTASPTFTGTVSGITASMVGLGNVDNTSDATKNAASVTLTNKTLTDPIIDDGLRLNHETSVTTPASGKVSLFAKNDDKLYLTNSSGVTSPVAASGTGEKNYVSNPSAASSTTGWANVGDLDIARTTTASELPREYTTATGFKITADSNTQSVADYVYFDFTLDDVDLSKKLKIEWSQKLFGAYTAGQLAVVITTQADRTTALHTPVTTAIPAADGVFTTSFDSSTTATLSLVIRATTDMTTDTGIVISDVVVGPGTITQGAAVSEWQTFTPSTTSSWTTNATWTGKYRREGSMARIKYGVTLAGAPGGTAQLGVNLPTGLTLDTSNILAMARAEKLGTLAYYQNANAGVGYMLQAWAEYDSSVSTSGKVRFLGVDDVNTSTHTVAAITASYPNTWGNGDYLQIELLIPIAEWAGNGTVNLGAGAQVEYASNSGSTATAGGSNSAASTVYGPAGSTILSVASTTVSNTTDFICRFQYPIQSDDVITLEINNGNGWFDAQNIMPHSYVNTSIYGLQVTVTNSTDVTVSFGNKGARAVSAATYAADGQAWSVFAGLSYKWRVRKAKASSPIGFGLASSTASGLTPATAVLGLLRYNTSNGYGSTNTTIRRFSTLVSNTGSVTYADSSTAGTTFTITVSGIYAITYSDEFSGGASMGLSKNSSQLTTNIAGITAADRLVMASASAANNTTTVSWTGYLDASDVIRAHADATTSGASTVRATFTIQRIA